MAVGNEILELCLFYIYCCNKENVKTLPKVYNDIRIVYNSYIIVN